MLKGNHYIFSFSSIVIRYTHVDLCITNYSGIPEAFRIYLISVFLEAIVERNICYRLDVLERNRLQLNKIIVSIIKLTLR